MLNKFKDDMNNNIDNLDKKVIEKENNFNTRLNKIKNNVKKIKTNKNSLDKMNKYEINIKSLNKKTSR